ncbi:MAG: MarC family protein [Nanoarchaeota archaeon]
MLEGYAIGDILQGFMTLIVIMDPFVSLPVLLSMTKGVSAAQRRAITDKAVLIAGTILLLFFIASNKIFNVLGIGLPSFMIAGGIVLLILGIEGALGISFQKSKESEDVHVAAVVIGTPLITGPGTITSMIVLVETKGYLVTGVAGLMALIVTWAVLRSANTIYKHAGEKNIEVFSRIMGLLVMAIAIEFIARGILKIVAGV